MSIRVAGGDRAPDEIVAGALAAATDEIRMAARGIDHDIVERLRESLPERVVESARSTNPSGTTRG